MATTGHLDALFSQSRSHASRIQMRMCVHAILSKQSRACTYVRGKINLYFPRCMCCCAFVCCFASMGFTSCRVPTAWCAAASRRRDPRCLTRLGRRGSPDRSGWGPRAPISSTDVMSVRTPKATFPETNHGFAFRISHWRWPRRKRWLDHLSCWRIWPRRACSSAVDCRAF